MSPSQRLVSSWLECLRFTTARLPGPTPGDFDAACSLQRCCSPNCQQIEPPGIAAMRASGVMSDIHAIRGSCVQRQAARTAVLMPTVVEKRCTKCRTTKPSELFFRFKNSSDGLQSYCKVRGPRPSVKRCTHPALCLCPRVCTARVAAPWVL